MLGGILERCKGWMKGWWTGLLVCQDKSCTNCQSWSNKLQYSGWRMLIYVASEEYMLYALKALRSVLEPQVEKDNKSHSYQGNSFCKPDDWSRVRYPVTGRNFFTIT